MSPARTITDEELLQLPEDGQRYEVVDGELVASPPAGLRHAQVLAELIFQLGSFAEERRLGLVLGCNLLYILPSGNRRGSDLTFISAAKAAQLGPDTVFPELAPDLAVEVLSPFDSPRRWIPLPFVPSARPLEGTWPARASACGGWPPNAPACSTSLRG